MAMKRKFVQEKFALVTSHFPMLGREALYIMCSNGNARDVYNTFNKVYLKELILLHLKKTQPFYINSHES